MSELLTNIGSLSSTLTVLIIVGALGLLLFALVNRSKNARRGRSVSVCSMCERSTPETKMNEWHIRGVKHPVCPRCHPFYKLRFEDNEPG